MAGAADRWHPVTSYVIPCDSCGIRMIVSDRRRLLCDECADDLKDSEHSSHDHIPPWQVHG